MNAYQQQVFAFHMDRWSINYSLIDDVEICFKFAMDTMRRSPDWGIRVVKYTMPQDGDVSKITCEVLAEFAPPFGSLARKPYDAMMAKRAVTSDGDKNKAEYDAALDVSTEDSLDAMGHGLEAILANEV